MLPDNESTPPVNTFGAQRALGRELAAIRANLHALTRLVVIQFVLYGGLFALWAITLASR